jgi:hypothetical protein
MATYAVIENGTVINVIVADSKEIAEQITEKTCIEYTEDSPLGMGWYWLNEAGGYIPPAPFETWTYDISSHSWVSPIPMPIEEGKFFIWNREANLWDGYLNEF